MKSSRRLAGLMIGLLVILAACKFTDEYDSHEFSEPIGEAASAEIRLSMPFENATIHAGDDPERLFNASIQTVGDVQYRVTGTTNKTVQLAENLGNISYTGEERLQWDIGLGTAIPINFILNMNDGDLEADLTGVNLSAFQFTLYTGEATITLPDNAVLATNSSSDSIAALGQPTEQAEVTVVDEDLAEAVESADVESVVTQVVGNILEIALVEVGVGQLTLKIPANALIDFDEIVIAEGSARFEIGENVDFDTNLEVGKGDFVLDIAEGAAVQVNITRIGQEGKVVLPPDYRKVANGETEETGIWESPNYQQSAIAINITGEIGSGSFTIE